MILRAYLTKRNGDVLFSKSFDPSLGDDSPSLPPYVQAAIALLSSSKSTKLEQVYTHTYHDTVWAYMFFESFVIVFLVTEDENQAMLTTRMIALGHSIALMIGKIISSWDGDLGEIVGVDTLFIKHVTMDLSPPSERVLQVAESLVNRTLEDPNIAYVGILDMRNEMVSGNFPETLLEEIVRELYKGIFGSDVDMIPKTLKIRRYSHQIFRAGPLTVIVTPYPEGSTIKAATMAGDIAHKLLKVIDESDKSAK